MTRDAAIALVQALLGAARRGDVQALARLYADDAVVISPLFGEVRGAEAIAASWRALFSTAPDFSAEISHMLADGDRIAVLGTVSTTDRGGWFGLPPTGGPIGYKLVLLFTVAGGQVVRDERIYDSTGVVERLEKFRLDKELRTAAEVQRTLLSRTRLVTPSAEAAGDSLPCRAIGGDFFEFLDLRDGRVGIALGDVSGKGPAAALLAAMVQGMFVVEAPNADGPGATLARINACLARRSLGARYVTLVYAVLSPEGCLVYANGGHMPPVLLTGGRVERLTGGGPMVGMFPDAVFADHTVRLSPGDTLVCFTDGVTDARNRFDEEFGEERLLECLPARQTAAPRALVDRVFGAVREFCGGAEPIDDVTLAVARFAAPVT